MNCWFKRAGPLFPFPPLPFPLPFSLSHPKYMYGDIYHSPNTASDSLKPIYPMLEFVFESYYLSTTMWTKLQCCCKRCLYTSVRTHCPIYFTAERYRPIKPVIQRVFLHLSKRSVTDTSALFLSGGADHGRAVDLQEYLLTFTEL